MQKKSTSKIDITKEKGLNTPMCGDEGRESGRQGRLRARASASGVGCHGPRHASLRETEKSDLYPY